MLQAPGQLTADEASELARQGEDYMSEQPRPTVTALWRQVDSRLRALAKMRAAQLAECQRQLRQEVAR